ncbi:MAG: hypothetical protein HYT09_04190 [Candidatus Levybacteria bacterium]|nr:hypothetical protein [Candidatus Levybacteria bacterium]
MNQKRDDEGREFYVRTGMEDVDLWKERISEIGDAMLAINDIHTEDTWPGGRIDNMIEEMTNDEPIRFSWVITDFKSKYTGEAEFKLFYINARDGRPPSETDSMNGWEWKNGTMAVKFHFRYRANRYLKSPTKDMAWFKSIDTEYNEDFSEWHERYDGLYFEKRDGVWRLERTFPPRGFFDYIIEGSQVLEPFPMQWLFVKDGVWCEPNQAGTGGGLCD